MENVLFTNKDNESQLKLIDFGLSDHFKSGNNMHSMLGTPYYIAPEVLELKGPGYGPKCDCWSIGVITYMLLSGTPPFGGNVSNFVRFILLNDRSHDARFYECQSCQYLDKQRYYESSKEREILL